MVQRRQTATTLIFVMGTAVSSIAICCLQVQEYGVGVLRASYRRLTCSDVQRMLQLDTGGVQDQLKALLEQLVSR